MAMEELNRAFVPKQVMSKFLRHQQVAKPFENLAYSQFDAVVREQMASEAQDSYQELLYAYTERCIVEPEYGWALSKDFQLIAESYPHGQFVLEEFRPTVDARQFAGQKKIKLKTAVLLWENCSNYFHFLNDFVGRLALLDRQAVPRDIPVIVSEEVASSPYFRQFGALCPKFFARNWVFQAKDQYYEIEATTYFVHNILCMHENFQPLLEELSAVEYTTPSPEKVFITRRGNHGRGLINTAEIEAIAQSHGFEIIDAQDYTIQQQVGLFANVTHIIGLHGAGLANMIYAKHKGVRVLEIFPGNFCYAVYYWLASQFSHHYQCLRGLPTTDDQQDVTPSSVVMKSNFYLPPDSFSDKLLAWLHG